MAAKASQSKIEWLPPLSVHLRKSKSMEQFRNRMGRFIEIRLFREPEVDNQDTDDKIVIVPVNENTYDIIYDDAYSQVQHKVRLDGHGVDMYLSALFCLLQNDKDPYRGIQFQIPAFPSILYSVNDLRSRTIRKYLNSLLPLLKEAHSIRTD